MKQNLLNERFITIEKLADGGFSHKLPGLTVKFSLQRHFWEKCWLLQHLKAYAIWLL